MDHMRLRSNNVAWQVTRAGRAAGGVHGGMRGTLDSCLPTCLPTLPTVISMLCVAWETLQDSMGMTEAVGGVTDPMEMVVSACLSLMYSNR